MVCQCCGKRVCKCDRLVCKHCGKEVGIEGNGAPDECDPCYYTRTFLENMKEAVAWSVIEEAFKNMGWSLADTSEPE